MEIAELCTQTSQCAGSVFRWFGMCVLLIGIPGWMEFFSACPPPPSPIRWRPLADLRSGWVLSKRYMLSTRAWISTVSDLVPRMLSSGERLDYHRMALLLCSRVGSNT